MTETSTGAPAPESTDPPTVTTTDAPAPDAPATGETDYRAEVERWKAESKKQEQRAKANAKAAQELESVKQASMSDLEKAVAAARVEARQEVMRDASRKLVAAEVRAAVAGRTVKAEDLLENLDPTRFVSDDGEVDTDAITAWVDRIAPRGAPRGVDLGQGPRGRTASSAEDPLLADLRKKLGF